MDWSWSDYVGKKKPIRKDLRLFPNISRTDPDVVEMLVRRFRWLHKCVPGAPSGHFVIWTNPENAFLDERLSNPRLSLDEFHKKSRTFPFLLAKTEVDWVRYYWILRDFLLGESDRKNLLSLHIGPTFGGEIETVIAAGGRSYFETKKWSRWSAVAEERLIHDDIPYENWDETNLSFRFVTISPWVSDFAKEVQKGYDALGRSGFILFPSTINVLDQTRTLGLERVKRFELEIWRKHSGLPEKVKDVHYQS